MPTIEDLLSELDETLAESNDAAVVPRSPRSTSEKLKSSSSRSGNGEDSLRKAALSKTMNDRGGGGGDDNTKRPATYLKQQSSSSSSHAANELDDLLDLLGDASVAEEGGGGRYKFPGSQRSCVSYVSPAVSPHQSPKASPRVKATQPTSGLAKKCIAVYIGGNSSKRGHCASVTLKSLCDNLRCTSCDFHVLQLPDRAWEEDVDYMFFRNNYPDERKLGGKVKSVKGGVAYACQCSWESATVTTRLEPSATRWSWVCAGH